MNRYINRLAAASAALALFLLSLPQSALGETELRLPRLFSDNMVLQQGMTVPVWGWGQDGTTVTVTFRDQTVSALVVDGQWRVNLRNLKPGGPDTLTVTVAGG